MTDLDSQKKMNMLSAQLAQNAAIVVTDGLITAAEKGEVPEADIPRVYLTTGVYSLASAVGGFLQCNLNREMTAEEHRDILAALNKALNEPLRQIIIRYAEADGAKVTFGPEAQAEEPPKTA